MNRAADPAFEQRSAVLVAHSSDILIYHVREDNMGTDASAGLPLLKAMFEVSRTIWP